MTKKKTSLKDEFKPTFSDDGDTVLSGGKRFSRQHYEEDLKSQQQYDHLIDKLFILSIEIFKPVKIGKDNCQEDLHLNNGKKTPVNTIKKVNILSPGFGGLP